MVGCRNGAGNKGDASQQPQVKPQQQQQEVQDNMQNGMATDLNVEQNNDDQDKLKDEQKELGLRGPSKKRGKSQPQQQQPQRTVSRRVRSQHDNGFNGQLQQLQRQQQQQLQQLQQHQQHQQQLQNVHTQQLNNNLETMHSNAQEQQKIIDKLEKRLNQFNPDALQSTGRRNSKDAQELDHLKDMVSNISNIQRQLQNDNPSELSDEFQKRLDQVEEQIREALKNKTQINGDDVKGQIEDAITGLAKEFGSKLENLDNIDQLVDLKNNPQHADVLKQIQNLEKIIQNLQNEKHDAPSIQNDSDDEKDVHTEKELAKKQEAIDQKRNELQQRLNDMSLDQADELVSAIQKQLQAQLAASDANDQESGNIQQQLENAETKITDALQTSEELKQFIELGKLLRKQETDLNQAQENQKLKDRPVLEREFLRNELKLKQIRDQLAHLNQGSTGFVQIQSIYGYQNPLPYIDPQQQFPLEPNILPNQYHYLNQIPQQQQQILSHVNQHQPLFDKQFALQSQGGQTDLVAQQQNLNAEKKQLEDRQNEIKDLFLADPEAAKKLVEDLKKKLQETRDKKEEVESKLLPKAKHSVTLEVRQKQLQDKLDGKDKTIDEPRPEQTVLQKIEERYNDLSTEAQELAKQQILESNNANPFKLVTTPPENLELKSLQILQAAYGSELFRRKLSEIKLTSEDLDEMSSTQGLLQLSAQPKWRDFLDQLPVFRNLDALDKTLQFLQVKNQLSIDELFSTYIQQFDKHGLLIVDEPPTEQLINPIQGLGYHLPTAQGPKQTRTLFQDAKQTYDGLSLRANNILQCIGSSLGSIQENDIKFLNTFSVLAGENRMLTTYVNHHEQTFGQLRIQEGNIITQEGLAQRQQELEYIFAQQLFLEATSAVLTNKIIFGPVSHEATQTHFAQNPLSALLTAVQSDHSKLTSVREDLLKTDLSLFTKNDHDVLGRWFQELAALDQIYKTQSQNTLEHRDQIYKTQNQNTLEHSLQVELRLFPQQQQQHQEARHRFMTRFSDLAKVLHGCLQLDALVLDIQKTADIMFEQHRLALDSFQLTFFSTVQKQRQIPLVHFGPEFLNTKNMLYSAENVKKSVAEIVSKSQGLSKETDVFQQLQNGDSDWLANAQQAVVNNAARVHKLVQTLPGRVQQIDDLPNKTFAWLFVRENLKENQFSIIDSQEFLERFLPTKINADQLVSAIRAVRDDHDFVKKLILFTSINPHLLLEAVIHGLSAADTDAVQAILQNVDDAARWNIFWHVVNANSNPIRGILHANKALIAEMKHFNLFEAGNAPALTNLLQEVLSDGRDVLSSLVSALSHDNAQTFLRSTPAKFSNYISNIIGAMNIQMPTLSPLNQNQSQDLLSQVAILGWSPEKRVAVLSHAADLEDNGELFKTITGSMKSEHFQTDLKELFAQQAAIAKEMDDAMARRDARFHAQIVNGGVFSSDQLQNAMIYASGKTMNVLNSVVGAANVKQFSKNMMTAFRILGEVPDQVMHEVINQVDHRQVINVIMHQTDIANVERIISKIDGSDRIVCISTALESQQSIATAIAAIVSTPANSSKSNKSTNFEMRDVFFNASKKGITFFQGISSANNVVEGLGEAFLAQVEFVSHAMKYDDISSTIKKLNNNQTLNLLSYLVNQNVDYFHGVIAAMSEDKLASTLAMLLQTKHVTTITQIITTAVADESSLNNIKKAMNDVAVTTELENNPTSVGLNVIRAVGQNEELIQPIISAIAQTPDRFKDLFREALSLNDMNIAVRMMMRTDFKKHKDAIQNDKIIKDSQYLSVLSAAMRNIYDFQLILATIHSMGALKQILETNALKQLLPSLFSQKSNEFVLDFISFVNQNEDASMSDIVKNMQYKHFGPILAQLQTAGKDAARDAIIKHMKPVDFRTALVHLATPCDTQNFEIIEIIILAKNDHTKTDVLQHVFSPSSIFTPNERATIAQCLTETVWQQLQKHGQKFFEIALNALGARDQDMILKKYFKK